MPKEEPAAVARNQHFAAILNCGFPEPEQCATAFAVLCGVGAPLKDGEVSVTPITGWLYAYRKLMVVDMACRLRLFTLLDERARPAEELASLTGARIVPLTCLLDACVGLGLLTVEDGRYAGCSIARAYLVEGRPLYHGDLFRVFASEAPQWGGLRDLVRGAPRGEAGDPGGGGATAGEDVVDAKQFTRAMHALGALGEAEALASSVDLSGRRDLVDVGCGSGVYSIALCRRYPDLRATLIDRPEVLEVTAEYLAESGVESRTSLAPGDFLVDGYGRDRDVVLLSDVLYQESDICRAMLDLAHQSLVSGGRLVIRGYFYDRGAGHGPFGALFDLDRLLTGPDREPLLVETILRWVADAGFAGARSFPLSEQSTVVLAEK